MSPRKEVAWINPRSHFRELIRIPLPAYYPIFSSSLDILFTRMLVVIAVCPCSLSTLPLSWLTRQRGLEGDYSSTQEVGSIGRGNPRYPWDQASGQTVNTVASRAGARTCSKIKIPKLHIICNKPTRCNSGSIVFINNYNLMFFWPCIMNWLCIDYQLDAPIIIYS